VHIKIWKNQVHEEVLAFNPSLSMISQSAASLRLEAIAKKELELED
jgi:hypothetical protein